MSEAGRPDSAMRSGASATSTVSTRETREALELPSYLALIAAEASTDLGSRALLETNPTDDREVLAKRQRAAQELTQLILSGGLVPSIEEPLEPLIARLASGAVGGERSDPLEGSIDGLELLLLARVLGITTEARQRILSEDEPPKIWSGRARRLADLSDLCRAIDKALDPRGEVRDDASPLLRRLRRDVRKVRDRLYRSLKQLLQSHGDHFSEETIPLHGGRLVLMLNSGARGRVPGLVHGRSSTGRSFYFEPFESVEANNELQALLEEERAERIRILAELVARAKEEGQAIAEHSMFLAELDSGQACCRFAVAADARFADIGPPDAVEIKGARHPLLDPALASRRARALGSEGHLGEIVPLDLELSPELRWLVVTGPNAGGKTAALKTLGLLALAHQCGFPVPVDPGTRLPVLRHVVAAIGDDQDLLADQSTFSGRLARLKEVWESAGAGSLVLLDELGSGTDPEEGAALSTTLLEGLLDRQTLGLVTTHLTPVAALAMESEGAACAAMEFDDHSGRPTYRLQPGAPGGSHAIDLARNMGLPEEWLDRAEAVLGDDHRRLRGVLAEVEEMRVQLERERRETESVRHALDRREAELETEREELVEERGRIAKSARRELREFREKVRGELRAEIERLAEKASRSGSSGAKSGAKSGSKKRSRAAVPETMNRLFESAPEIAGAEALESAPVEVGQDVEHISLRWVGAVERKEKGKVWVRVRGMSMAVSEGDLRPASRNDGASGQQTKPRVSRPKVEVRSTRAGAGDDGPTVARELKLIGRRVEPALDELDSYLDRALLASVEEVRVIHGHGTGRLRDAVREHLRSHPAVDRWRRAPREQGGDGATLVTLQSA